MHPVRKFILFRWVLYLAVVLGVGAFVATRNPAAPNFTSDVAKQFAPKKVQLPPPDVVKTLDSAISVLKGERVPFGGVDRVEPSLIALHQEVTATGQKKLPVRLSGLFLGPPKKFVMINTVLYEVGDSLPDGRKVKDIQADGVVLGAGDVEERIEWRSAFRVELKKPAQAAAPAGETGEAGTAGQTEPGQRSPSVDLKNLPENPTPAQALNILQEMKKQQAQKK
jgi:hypothetical protein